MKSILIQLYDDEYVYSHLSTRMENIYEQKMHVKAQFRCSNVWKINLNSCYVCQIEFAGKFHRDSNIILHNRNHTQPCLIGPYPLRFSRTNNSIKSISILSEFQLKFGKKLPPAFTNSQFIRRHHKYPTPQSHHLVCCIFVSHLRFNLEKPKWNVLQQREYANRSSFG